ncbi:MAG: metallophosphoesterase, partial [Clostridia bacterium]|nr:metallophosphoesterase [Clostridia bacterium]
MDIDLEETLSNKMKLTVGKNEDFKVLAFSDSHLYGPNDSQASVQIPRAVAIIKTIVDRENPNLVIFNGDNISAVDIQTDDYMRETIAGIVGYIEEKKIPWVHVYGNHDSENGYTRAQQQAVYESFDYCLSKYGPAHIGGVGNYVIPVYAEDGKTIKFAVWGLDSGDYLSEEDKATLPETTGWNDKDFPDVYQNGGYDYIKVDQINWYRSVSKALQEYNNGVVVPGLMAFHIALQESSYAWDVCDQLLHTGEKNESVHASPYNSGLFSAILQRGDIKAIVNGHDHKNTFMVEYRGVKLCQVGKVGISSYYDEKLLGGRVFVFNESDPEDINTYMSFENGVIEGNLGLENGQAQGSLEQGGEGIVYFTANADLVMDQWNFGASSVDTGYVYSRYKKRADTVVFD